MRLTRKHPKNLSQLTAKIANLENTVLDILSIDATIALPNYEYARNVYQAVELLEKFPREIEDDIWALVNESYNFKKQNKVRDITFLTLETSFYDMILSSIIFSCLFAAERIESNYRMAANLFRFSRADRNDDGRRVFTDTQIYLNNLKEEGIVGFVDKANKQWKLKNYLSMKLVSTVTQIVNTGILEDNPSHDLYIVSEHGTTCPVCSPLEGRVVSKSGTDLNFPPITLVFPKRSQNGPNNYLNTYLEVHPNCIHYLIEFHPENYSEAGLNYYIQFSDPINNPINIDRRSREEQESYTKQQKKNAKISRSYDQYVKYKSILGSKAPDSFGTFYKEKMKNSEQYNKWVKLYRITNKELKTGV